MKLRGRLVPDTTIHRRMAAKDARINREMASRRIARAKRLGQEAARTAAKDEQNAVNPYPAECPEHKAWADAYAFEHWKAAHL